MYANSYNDDDYGMADDRPHGSFVNIHKRWQVYYAQKRKPYVCLPRSPSNGREGFVAKFDRK